MGLSHFPNPTEYVFPLMIINTVLPVSLLKNISRFILHFVDSSNSEDHPDEQISRRRRRRRISNTQFKSLCQEEGCCNGGNESGMECCCCVCLCRFEAEEEVSELQSCKHFFHRVCLDKWFCSNNQHTSCPLCRSIL